MRPRTGDLLACLTLIVLTLGCFARLVIQPGALIVDGDRRSIDYAQRIDPRPVGNDVTFSFLPRYLQVSEAVKRTGRLPPWDPAGLGGRPPGGEPPGGPVLPPGLAAARAPPPPAVG